MNVHLQAFQTGNSLPYLEHSPYSNALSHWSVRTILPFHNILNARKDQLRGRPRQGPAPWSAAMKVNIAP